MVTMIRRDEDHQFHVSREFEQIAWSWHLCRISAPRHGHEIVDCGCPLTLTHLAKQDPPARVLEFVHGCPRACGPRLRENCDENCVLAHASVIKGGATSASVAFGSAPEARSNRTNSMRPKAAAAIKGVASFNRLS
jgi:hypothetical protein